MEYVGREGGRELPGSGRWQIRALVVSTHAKAELIIDKTYTYYRFESKQLINGRIF